MWQQNLGPGGGRPRPQAPNPNDWASAAAQWMENKKYYEQWQQQQYQQHMQMMAATHAAQMAQSIDPTVINNPPPPPPEPAKPVPSTDQKDPIQTNTTLNETNEKSQSPSNLTYKFNIRIF